MTFIEHALLFFFSGFAGYILHVDRNNSFGIFLLFALPIGGVYFLGWWALLNVLTGLVFGGRVFWANIGRGHSGSEE